MAHLILFFLIHWSSHAFFLCSIVVSLFLLLSCIVYSSSSRWQNKPQCQLNRLLKTLTCSVMFSFVIWKTVAQMKNNAELLFVDNVETMANVLHEPFQFPSLSTNRSFAFFSFEPQFSILNERKHHWACQFFGLRIGWWESRLHQSSYQHWIKMYPPLNSAYYRFGLPVSSRLRQYSLIIIIRVPNQ